MAKKKEEAPSDNQVIAQMYGTISRVYGILGLFCEPETMQGRWEAVDKWCSEHPNGVTYKDKKCSPIQNPILKTED